MSRLFAKLKGVRRCGDGWTARCPAHTDDQNSLSIHHCNGRWLLNCHAGCNRHSIIDALGIDTFDLYDEERPGARPIPLITVQPRN